MKVGLIIVQVRLGKVGLNDLADAKRRLQIKEVIVPSHGDCHNCC